MDPEQLPLRDLHLPEPIGWWPLAPGWWVLIALAVAGLVYLLYRQYLVWRSGRARRVALKELGRVRREYADGQDAVRLAKALSELTRRSMLAYAPRGEVAGLTGEAWLEWLDRGLEQQPFTRGAGRALETLPYLPAERIDDDVDVGGLIDAVAERLKTPLGEAA